MKSLGPFGCVVLEFFVFFSVGEDRFFGVRIWRNF